MDGLLVLLAIIGLVAKISKKKKKQEEQRRRQAGFKDASQLPVEDRKSSAAEKISDAFETVEKEAEQLKIPYTKDEWSKFLKENAPSKPANAAPKHVQKAVLRSADPSLISRMEAVRPAHSDMEAAEGLEFEKLNAQRLRPDDRHLEGESRKEHAAHKARIFEEEARLQREHAELQELRSMNLKKLRTAVVMSEVLGKPVALRGKR